MQDRPRALRRRTVLTALGAGTAATGTALWWSSGREDTAASPPVTSPVAGPTDPVMEGRRITGPGVRGRARRIAFTPEGTGLTWVEADGRVPEVDLLTGALSSGAPVTGADGPQVLSPDGTTVAGTGAPGDGDSTVVLRERPGGRELARLPHPTVVDRVLYDTEGTRLLTRALDGSYRVWDARTGALSGPAVTADFGALGVSPDGRQLAVESGLDEVQLWAVDTHRLHGRIASAPGGDLTLVFVPGTRLLALPTVAAVDGQVQLWDIDSGRGVATLVDCTVSGGESGRPVAVTAVATDPAGRRIAAGTEDGTVRLWEVASGRVLGPPLTMQPGLRELALSPDGATLVALGQDQVFTLWRVGGFRVD